ncbi:MAG: glutamate--cysteine ligase [Thiotrichales bacterium]
MNPQSFAQDLLALREHDPTGLLAGSLKGLEKESLRVTQGGTISPTAHPAALGSALTHPLITTDYSEAQLELITEPHTTPMAVMVQLDELHRWVYQNLEHQEILWATSMPCLLQGEASVRIGEYGHSNAGLMKTVYRRGLGHRYGRIMQAISGVHYNYSLPQDYWRWRQNRAGDVRDPVAYRSDGYMGTLRNLQRIGWLVPYLFGASPAICESFLDGKSTTLEYFGNGTYYESFATSLRLGDIGYQNTKEGRVGVRVSYDSLDDYIASLDWAISQPCAAYQDMGVCVEGDWRQLNANLLQIENEYYSSVRAKVPLQRLEKPVRALRARGVQYIELRSVDVNAFEPLGISIEQLYFLETLALYATVLESPKIEALEREMINNNFFLVAHSGRDHDLVLSRPHGKDRLRDWAEELLSDLSEVAAVLDQAYRTDLYSTVVARQLPKVHDANLLPSARMLELMRERQESFFEFALSQSRLHARYFNARPLSAAKQERFAQDALRSRQLQADLEAMPQARFDEFLAAYFAQ